MAPGLMRRWRLGLTLIAFSMAGCATVTPQATVLVEYHRSGGITGRDDRLVVYSDGRAQLTRRGAAADFAVGADTLARLRALLQQMDAAGLRGEYLPSRRGADLFEYVLVSRDRRVRTMDTAVPPELQPLIQLLSGLANRSR